MSKSIGQIGYEALRDAKRDREVLTARGVAFSLSAAVEYDPCEDWEYLPPEEQSDWEDAATNMLMAHFAKHPQK